MASGSDTTHNVGRDIHLLSIPYCNAGHLQELRDQRVSMKLLFVYMCVFACMHYI